MADAVTARAAPLLPILPDEIVVWEILVRLPPKSLLRCRAVCPAWRRTTSTRDFLLAHHGRQPPMPVVCVYGKPDEHWQDIIAFDHRAADARLQPVARLDSDKFCWLQASCDGLVILSREDSISVWNPATRQHALLRQPAASGFFSVLGMYLHRPSGEYRLLLFSMSYSKIGCYVLALGSDQPPRYIGGPKKALAWRVHTPALARDNLHWSPLHHQRVVTVFDTTAESFRQMRAPIVPAIANSYIFEMDGILGMYSYNDAMEVVDIWVLQNYEGEVWENKYRVELPVTEIRRQLGRVQGSWDVNVISADGDVLLLICHGQWLFYVEIDGKLVDSFHRDGQQFHAYKLRLKQTLLHHTFFRTTEDCAVNDSPFHLKVVTSGGASERLAEVSS